MAVRAEHRQARAILQPDAGPLATNNFMPVSFFLKQVTAVFLISMVFLAIGLFIGNRYSVHALEAETQSDSQLSLEVLTRANEVDVAVTALNFMEKGDIPDAQAMLEGQLRSSLTILHSLVSTGLASLPKDKIDSVNEAISEGDEYANKHGITINKGP